MTKFRLLISVCVCIISLLIDNSSSVATNLDMFKSEFGEGYGSDWIYFPDAAGEQHFIDFTMSKDATTVAGSATRKELLLPDEIEFRLYNENDTAYILLNNQGRALNESDQDTVISILQSSIPLKLITHGWHSSADTDGILKIKNAYLIYENVNVITIDWSPIARSLNYIMVAIETSAVGALVAKFLDGLNEEYNVNGDRLHLIGHSLGAHVMGIAAAKTKSSVYRVTGLDPARPFFEYPTDGTFERLNASDAEIVDVIHTCAGLLGYEGAIGTVDFYPNGGGAPQPGCGDIIKFLEACSHSMSLHYFLESIKDPKIYPAYECQSWRDFLDKKCNHTGYMGEGIDRNMTGTYYLTTNGMESFSYDYPAKEDHENFS